MSVAFKIPEASEHLALREAMRRLVGSVAVITAGVGDERTGLTATSAVSLSMDPPTMLICVNRTSSTWPVLLRRRHFCVNVLHADQADVAKRFAGAGGIKGVARYDGASWIHMGSGASGLAGALAIIDCDVEEIIERHSHGIVLGPCARSGAIRATAACWCTDTVGSAVSAFFDLRTGRASRRCAASRPDRRSPLPSDLQ